MKYTSLSLLFVCLGNSQLFASNQSPSSLGHYYLLFGLLGILVFGLAFHTILMYRQIVRSEGLEVLPTLGVFLMQTNRLHLRNILQYQLNMFEVRLGFKLLENLQNIMVNVHAVGADNFHNRIIRHFVQ